MITRFELVVRPQRDALLPAEHGRQVKGLVYGWLRVGDPAVAGQAHPSPAGGTAAFTCSHLLEAPPPQEGGCRLSRGECYRLQVTALTAAVGRALVAGMPRLGGSVHLDRVPLHVLDLRVVEQVAYADLLRRPTAARWRLCFLSPVVLTVSTPADRDTSMLLPLPRLLVHSLLRRWEALAPAELPRAGEGFLQAVEGMVHLSDIRELASAPQWAERAMRGLVGEVELAVLGSLSPSDFALLNVLLHYAPYAGIGGRTAEGRGAVAAEPVR